ETSIRRGRTDVFATCLRGGRFCGTAALPLAAGYAVERPGLRLAQTFAVRLSTRGGSSAAPTRALGLFIRLAALAPSLALAFAVVLSVLGFPILWRLVNGPHGYDAVAFALLGGESQPLACGAIADVAVIRASPLKYAGDVMDGGYDRLLVERVV